jgi:hypothetical protein
VPLGQVVAGPLAAVAGPRAGLLAAATVIVLAVVGMLATPAVRTLPRVAAPALGDPELAATING